MPEITIDATTAQLIGDTCAQIARVAGLAPGLAGLVGCGVGLATRLSDAGYAAPSLAELQRLADEITALPNLPENPGANASGE